MRLFILLIALLLACPAWAQALAASAQPAASTQCEAAIAAAQQQNALPTGLLHAIGIVESGRTDPASGATHPWPWTIDANGDGRMFDTKAQAIEAVRTLQAHGVASIDVGCLQVNLLHHPTAFADLDQAFDPAANAAYAARFLRALFAETGDWQLAAAAYHSRTPGLGADYALLVMAAWRNGGRIPAAALAASAWLPHRFAELLPMLRPFAPPPLAGVAVDTTLGGQDRAALPTLLAPACVGVPPPTSWLLPGHTSACGRSAFTSAVALRQALAAIPPSAAKPAPRRPAGQQPPRETTP
jgi:hypothetical protein